MRKQHPARRRRILLLVVLCLAVIAIAVGAWLDSTIGEL